MLDYGANRSIINSIRIGVVVECQFTLSKVVVTAACGNATEWCGSHGVGVNGAPVFTYCMLLLSWQVVIYKD